MLDIDSVRFEYVLPDKTKADYVLCDRNGRALAVSEAEKAATPNISRCPKDAHFLFTVSGGKFGAGYATVRGYLREVLDDMQKAGDLVDGPFTRGDTRRTIETRLASAGVSQLVRAHLQSHGLGGIQARHHDRHDYLQEKRAALEALLQLLTAKKATVTPIAKARAKS